MSVCVVFFLHVAVEGCVHMFEKFHGHEILKIKYVTILEYSRGSIGIRYGTILNDGGGGGVV